MDYLGQILQEGDKILLLLARISGLALAPVYNARNTPLLWKVSFITFITLFGWQLGLIDEYIAPTNTVSYILILLIEIGIGIILSLVAQFFFAAIQLAGQLIDTQMGFGIMNVVDPISGTQAPIIGNFKYILAMLVYLQIDGHHLFLQALFDSYKVLPIGHLYLQNEFFSFLISFGGNIFLIACKIALPIVGALMVTDIISGIMARTIPQMNIFMVGMPAKILLGFGVLLIILPLYIYLMNSLIQDMIKQLYLIIRALR